MLMEVEQIENLPDLKKGFLPACMDGKIDPKFLCTHCNYILRVPVQNYCGHRFCKSCMLFLLQNPG